MFLVKAQDRVKIFSIQVQGFHLVLLRKVALNFFENSSIEAGWAGVGVNNQGFHDRSPLI